MIHACELDNVACKDRICMLSLLQDFEFIFFMKPTLNDFKTFLIGLNIEIF